MPRRWYPLLTKSRSQLFWSRTFALSMTQDIKTARQSLRSHPNEFTLLGHIIDFCICHSRHICGKERKRDYDTLLTRRFAIRKKLWTNDYKHTPQPESSAMVKRASKLDSYFPLVAIYGCFFIYSEEKPRMGDTVNSDAKIPGEILTKYFLFLHFRCKWSCRCRPPVQGRRIPCVGKPGGNIPSRLE